MTEDITVVNMITAQLRATEPNLTDGNFTSAVMMQLPRAGELPTWQKNAILLAATALGSATVAGQVPLAIIPELIDAAATNWPALLGTAVMLTYSSAIAAVWMARRY